MKIIQCVYLIVFLSGYVKILQPVDICTVVFVTIKKRKTGKQDTKQIQNEVWNRVRCGMGGVRGHMLS